MATDGAEVHCYTCISSYHLYLCLEYALERQKRHITITDLEATGLHGIAAHCNCIPNISLCYYLQVQFTYLDKLYGECSELLVHV